LELAKRIKGDVTQLSNRGVNENSKKRWEYAPTAKTKKEQTNKARRWKRS
jgi:hypothetical protein